MTKAPKKLHVTLSDGSLLHVNRTTNPPTIKQITPSSSLAREHGEIVPARLRIVSTTDSRRFPQFLIGELVSLMMISPESTYPIELYSGRIRTISPI
jgi:hypothetical protein